MGSPRTRLFEGAVLLMPSKILFRLIRWSFVVWLPALVGCDLLSGSDTQLRVEVVKEHGGEGSVVSTPAGIDCGTDCVASFSFGSVVRLTARAEGNSHFMGWSGACEGQKTTCQVSINQVREVGARFVAGVDLHIGLLGQEEAGMVRIQDGPECDTNCVTNHPVGTRLRLEAVPVYGEAVFEGWSGACSGKGICTIDMDEDKELGATFLFTQSLLVLREGVGRGVVRSEPPGIDCGTECRHFFNEGQQVRLIPQPAAGSAFAGWEGDCEGSGETCLLEMNDARRVSANFLWLRELHIDMSGGGSGRVTIEPGGIECEGECRVDIPHGTTVTLTAEQIDDSLFDSWTDDCLGPESTCVIEMTQPRSVNARFERGIRLAIGITGYGAVTSPDADIYCDSTCRYYFDEGEVVTLEAESQPTSILHKWGDACSGREPCTLVMAAPCSVWAGFVPARTITVNVRGTGQGTVDFESDNYERIDSATVKHPHGPDATVAAQPATGSRVSGWSGACAGSTGEICTLLTNVPGTHPLVATVNFSAFQPEWAGISAGGGHSCGLLTNGRAFCWGENPHGQLGTGFTSPLQGHMPVEVAGGHSWTQVTTGYGHSCGITEGGEAYCWGSGAHGQLGTGIQENESMPTPVQGGHSWVAITAGELHTCGLAGNGEAYCWGQGNHGRLGDGTSTRISVPVLVYGQHDWTAISAGGAHTCGITATGEAYCWGASLYGRAGTGVDGVNYTIPWPVEGQHLWSRIDSGLEHTCGVTQAGQAYCWGRNENGQLGIGTTDNSLVPAPVETQETWLGIVAGTRYSCGVTDDGLAKCWGRGFFGQLGDGNATDSHVPVTVSGQHQWIATSVGTDHTCGITAAGEAYCWGFNSHGRLGDSTTERRWVPVQVIDP